jgi:hypothetical protein
MTHEQILEMVIAADIIELGKIIEMATEELTDRAQKLADEVTS